MHESKRSWLQRRELANVGSGRWTKAGQGKEVFCLHCGANDIAARKGWATAKPWKEVTAKKSTRGLFEYNASIPSAREHVGYQYSELVCLLGRRPPRQRARVVAGLPYPRWTPDIQLQRASLPHWDRRTAIHS